VAVFIGALVTYETLVTTWVNSATVEDMFNTLGIFYSTSNRILLQGTVNKMRANGVSLPARSDELASLEQLTPDVVTSLNQLINSL
tara:strand:- start:816 stop:1073 length:258 start_codon:yes stop_codon:yes gene_type:complete